MKNLLFATIIILMGFAKQVRVGIEIDFERWKGLDTVDSTYVYVQE